MSYALWVGIQCRIINYGPLPTAYRLQSTTYYLLPTTHYLSMTHKIYLLNKRVADVSAKMMTWEVTTSFDGVLSEAELRKRFLEEFGECEGMCYANDKKANSAGGIDKRCSNRLFFWPLVSFNASDGRKHRYLVAVASEPLACYRKRFDRCLPRQVALYALADKILRGTCVWNIVGRNASVAENGNLLFVALWKNVLYVLVFMKGRLCHWSEDFGYGETFDECCQKRVERFKVFLKNDELFAEAYASDAFGEACLHGDEPMDCDELFRWGCKDPFWRHLDLDEDGGLKLREKHRYFWGISLLFVVCLLFVSLCENFWNSWFGWENGSDVQINNMDKVSPVELSLPATHDLEKMAWAEGHRDMLPAKWKPASRTNCLLPDFRLLGIVGGRTALVLTAAGETKTLLPGDLFSQYRVTRIGKDDVVLKCGKEEVRYEVGTR